MNYDKPLKLSKARRKELEKLKPGEVLPFKPEERPTYNAQRRVYKLSCAICGFRMRHRLYVCVRCGNCQACGGLNIPGRLNQSCQHCGNGATAKAIEPPSATIEYRPDDTIGNKRDNVEIAPVDGASIKSVLIGNANQPPK